LGFLRMRGCDIRVPRIDQDDEFWIGWHFCLAGLF
jgi:hypothetical protein